MNKILFTQFKAGRPQQKPRPEIFSTGNLFRMLPNKINSIQNIVSGVSVIICCYNSALRLPETLQHLTRQNIPGNFFMEIILVNNASTDNTAEMSSDIWSRIQCKNARLKIVDEPRPGQMFARKRGVSEAEFECIIFCDDDNWLDTEYVVTAYGVMNKDATIGAAGGQNLPVTNSNGYPIWFEEYKDKYGMGIPAQTSRDVSYRTFVLGAGMVTRRSLFLKIFDDRYPTLLSGRDGTNLSTGDDFEYSRRLLLWGYKLYYEEKLKLEHFVPKERLTIEYRQRLMNGIEEAGKILNEYDLALRVHKKNKNKNKTRLLLLSPFRILFSKLGWSKRVAIDEQLTFFYLFPFTINSNSPKALIKKFILRK